MSTKTLDEPFITTHLDTVSGASCRMLATEDNYAWVRHSPTTRPVTRLLTDLIKIPKYDWQVQYHWRNPDRQRTYSVRADSAAEARHLAEIDHARRSDFPLDECSLIVVHVRL